MRYTDSHSSQILNLKWRVLFYQHIGQTLMLMGNFEDANIEFQKAEAIKKKVR